MKLKQFFSALIRPGFWGGATGDVSGLQRNEPTIGVLPNVYPVSPDKGLQISAVWACVTILAETMASIPIVVFEHDKKGNKVEARNSLLWRVLRQPNALMTAHDFWVTMGLNRFLRGNAYAKITRNSQGDLVSLMPMSADQMQVGIVDGELLYQYNKDGNIDIYKADKILHWKGLGNGIIGLSTLEYMQATTQELVNAQLNATEMYGNGRQLQGILTIDQDLNDRQVKEIKRRFANMTPIQGDPADWLHVLPADMKFQQVSLSAADAQLLETRKFGIDEIGRWFGVPSALINSSGGTAASSVEQIVESFYRSTIHPLCTALEQAIRQRVMTFEEREKFTCEFKMNALQRANISARYSSYAQALQNGFMTRNEVRKLENLPPIEGADELTAQNNLFPVHMLGTQGTGQSQTPLGDPIKQ